MNQPKETPQTKPAAHKKNVKKVSSSGSSGAFIAMLIALTAGGGSYYVWQQQLITKQNEKSLELRIERLLNVIETKDAAQMARIEQLAAPHQHANLDRSLEALQQSIPQLGHQISQQQHKWSLAEADYLLRIAEQRLQINHDIPSAMAALKLAQQQLIVQQGPNYQELVANITEQLESLSSLEGTGFAQISSPLNSIIDGLTTLPFSVKKAAKTTSQQAPAQPDEGTKLTERAKYWGSVIWHDIKSLVTIQRSDQVIQPLITPEQRFLLQEQLRLKLETARLAALRHNQPLYRVSLDDASALLERYFDSSDNAVKSSITTLAQLIKISVDPELPSLQPLRQQLNAAQLPEFSPSTTVEEPAEKPL